MSMGESDIRELIDQVNADPQAREDALRDLPPQYRTQIAEIKDIPVRGENDDPMLTPMPAQRQDEPRPEPAAPPQPDPAVAQQLQQIQEELRLMKSKYDSEVPRFRKDAEENKQRAATLQRALEQMTELNRLADAARKAAPTQPEIPTDPRQRYGLTDEELAVGDESLSVAQKIARREAELGNQGVNDRLARMEALMTQRLKATFDDELAIKIPGFPTLADNPDWQEFRTRFDAARGESWGAMFDRAMESMNPRAVKAIVDAFRAEHPSLREEQPASALPSAMPASGGTPSTVSTVPVQTKKIYKSSEMHERLKNIGRLSVAQQNAFFAEYDAAKREGRIVIG